MLKVHCPVPHQYLNFPAGVSWGISLETFHGKICKQMDLCAPTVFQGNTEIGVCMCVKYHYRYLLQSCPEMVNMKLFDSSIWCIY